MIKYQLFIFFLLLNFSFFSCQRSSPTIGNPNLSSSCDGLKINDTCYPWGGTDSDNDGLTDDMENALGTDELKRDSDGDGRSDYCEVMNDTNPKDPTKYPESCLTGNIDDGALLAACMVYERQKEQNEHYLSNYLSSQCTIEDDPEDVDISHCNTSCSSYTEIDEMEECIEDCISTVEATETQITNCNSNVITNSSTASCQNYGLSSDATLQTLKITVTFGLTYRNILLIQNGVLSFVSWDGWARERVLTTAGRNGVDPVITPVVLVGNFLGAGIAIPIHKHKYYKEHILGAPASAGRDCPSGVNNKATVTINGKSYEWLLPGYMSFKIIEYQDSYLYGTDCILNYPNATYIASASNNFSYLTHALAVENKDINEEHNSNCKSFTISLDYKYYKTISDDETPENPFNLQDSELEEMCKEVIL